MARLRALRRVLVDALTAHDEQQRSALACAHFASYAPAGGDVNAMLLRARGPARGRCCRRISPLPSPTLTAAEQNKERRERETARAHVHTCAFSRLDVLRSTAFWAGDARQRRRERPRPRARADSRRRRALGGERTGLTAEKSCARPSAAAVAPLANRRALRCAESGQARTRMN